MRRIVNIIEMAANEAGRGGDVKRSVGSRHVYNRDGDVC